MGWGAPSPETRKLKIPDVEGLGDWLGTLNKRFTVLDHAPTDADFDSPEDAQTIVLDTANSKVWARFGGTWKGVVLA